MDRYMVVYDTDTSSEVIDTNLTKIEVAKVAEAQLDGAMQAYSIDEGDGDCEIVSGDDGGYVIYRPDGSVYASIIVKGV